MNIVTTLSTLMMFAGIPLSAGLYFSSRSTVFDVIGDDILPSPDSFNDEQDKKILNQIGEHKFELVKAAKDKPEFIFFPSGLLDEGSNKEKLIQGCSSSSRKVYTSIFHGTNIDLLNAVREGCVFEMEEYFFSNTFLRELENGIEDERQRATTNPQQEYLLFYLFRFKESPNEFKELKNIKLPPVLDSIASDRSSEIEGKKKLIAWCGNAFKKGFKGTKDDLFLLVREFCTLPKTI